MPLSSPRTVVVCLVSLVSLLLGVLTWSAPGSGATSLPTPAAAAAVPERLVVTGQGVRAVVSTRPFRLTTYDAAGRAILRQVPNTRPAPLIGATVDQPGGADTIEDRSLYAPFTFEVGQQVAAQFPASPWVGALVGAAHAGVQYSARDVVSFRRISHGLRLVVSTNDPVGRELVVRVRTPARGLSSCRTGAGAMPPRDDVLTVGAPSGSARRSRPSPTSPAAAGLLSDRISREVVGPGPTCVGRRVFARAALG